MTSLIFGSVYMAHQGIVAHRRSKQRQKNYERWEDLRDEYDEQKKIGRERESRSLDIQRTGSWGAPENYSDEYTARHERPILTLRDQQEANDARMSWRPQESWESPQRTGNNPFEADVPAPHRTASVPAIPKHLQPQPTVQPPPLPHTTSTPSMYWQARGEIKPQKTGTVWDDGLPAPLRVSRQSFEDYEYSARRGSAPVSNQPSRNNSLRQSRNTSIVPSRTNTPPVQIESRMMPSSTAVDDLSAKIASISVEPVQSHVPGGRMAELIERGY